MLSRAAKRFDEAFAAQPPHVQRAAALAIYRAWPAIQQYQKDLAPLFEDPAVVDAVWDLMIGAGLRLATKGRNAFDHKTIASVVDAAPAVGGMARALMHALAGNFAGAPSAAVGEEITKPEKRLPE